MPLFFIAASASVANADSKLLFEFDSPNAGSPWRTVNDGVMGGRSSGNFKINGSQDLEFFGNLSLKNNGGFASVRARKTGFGLEKGDLISVRVRGDGRKYNLNLYTQSNLGGYSYRQSFMTKKDEWIEVEFPVDNFAATWRGLAFPNQKLDPNEIRGIGFLIGDKKAGPFKLEVDWIKAGKSKN